MRYLTNHNFVRINPFNKNDSFYKILDRISYRNIYLYHFRNLQKLSTSFQKISLGNIKALMISKYYALHQKQLNLKTLYLYYIHIIRNVYRVLRTIILSGICLGV